MKRISQVFAIGIAFALCLGADESAFAGFVNGGFEIGTQGWTLKGGYNYGAAIDWVDLPSDWPQPLVVIRNQGYVDPYNCVFSTPFNDNHMLRINDIDPYYHATQVSQTATILSSDYQAGQSSATLYINWGAVLEDPGHVENQEPFVDISVTRVRGGVADEPYHMRHYADQPGWQQSATMHQLNTPIYTHGDQVQVPGLLAGDEVTVVITASDCAQGGHGGYAYIDGIGTTPIPAPDRITLTGTKVGNTTTLTLHGCPGGTGTIQHPADRCQQLDVWEDVATFVLDGNGNKTVTINNNGNRWDIYRAKDANTTYPSWGYVTKTLVPGKYVAVANPFIHGQNKLSELLPAGVGMDLTTVLTWDQTSGYIYSTYFNDDQSWDYDATLNPGDGALISYSGSANLDVVFSGYVPDGKLTHSVGQNNFLSPLTSQSGGVLDASDVGFSTLPKGQGRTIYRWNSDSEQWVAMTEAWVDRNDSWPEIGEPFFCCYTGTPPTETWQRTFRVWTPFPNSMAVAPHIASGTKNGNTTRLRVHFPDSEWFDIQHAHTSTGTQQLNEWADISNYTTSEGTSTSVTVEFDNGGNAWDVYRVRLWYYDWQAYVKNNSAWGYVTRTLVPGKYVPIANPFIQSDTRLSALFPPAGMESSELYYWDRPNHNWIISTCYPDDGGTLVWDNDVPLNPGDGALMSYYGGANRDVVLSGFVPTGALAKKLAQDLLLSELTAQSGGLLDGCFGLPAGTGRTVYRYDMPTQGWVVVPTSPIDNSWPQIGETFYVAYTGTAPTIWQRNMNIWNIVPADPSALNLALGSGGQVTLTWQDNSDNEEHFEIYRNSGSGFVLINTVAANVTTCTDNISAVATCQSVIYKVKAVNCAGKSADSNEATTSTGPQALVPGGGAISSTSFEAHWSACSDASGYYLDVATDSNFTSMLTAGGTTYDSVWVGNVTMLVINGLTPNTTYWYRVRSYNGLTSASSAAVSVKTAPAAPGATAATAITSSGFTANWTASTGATGYYLDVSTTSAFTSYVTGYNAKSVGNVTSSAVSGLNANTTYYYRVRASNGATGVNSGTITVKTASAVPTANPATSIASTSFVANWTTCTGATGYYLDIATDSGFTQFVSGFNNKSVGNYTSTSVTGLVANTTYYYRVRSYNGVASGNSGTITVKTAPAAPTANPASSITSSGFTANWSASTGATGYFLDVSTTSGFTSFVPGYIAKSVGNSTTSAVTGLAANTTYYYRVRASNGNSSGNSGTITVVTTP